MSSQFKPADRAIPNADMWRWTPVFFSSCGGFCSERELIKMAMAITLYGFADESGDPNQDNLLCVCGFLGVRDSWDDFSQRWDKALRRAHLRALHATKLLSSKRDARVREFLEAIRDTRPHLMALSVAIDLRHYRRLTTGQQNKIGRPLLICVSSLISLLEKCLKDWRTTRRGIAGINLTFDYSQEDSVEILETWIRLKKERRALIGSIKCVAFADDRFFYPLQAADLLANLTTRYWREGAPEELQEDHHLKRIFPRDKQGSPYLELDFITAERIDEAVRTHTKLF